MIVIDKTKLQDWFRDRWNLLVEKEKGMRGVRSHEQYELMRIDAVLNFIAEVSNKIGRGEFDK